MILPSIPDTLYQSTFRSPVPEEVKNNSAHNALTELFKRGLISEGLSLFSVFQRPADDVAPLSVVPISSSPVTSGQRQVLKWPAMSSMSISYCFMHCIYMYTVRVSIEISAICLAVLGILRSTIRSHQHHWVAR